MMTMTPDYEKAATLACETLIKYGINAAPISPLPILKRTPGVLVMSFEEVANSNNVSRQQVMDTLGCKNLDAVTTVFVNGDKHHYIVSYNKMLSSNLADRALARELGHILLGHDGSRPEHVRNEEARCFAHHLLCPRPLLHSIQAICIRLTKEVIGNLTGCYDHCLSCIRRQPGVHVDPALNRKIRDNFVPYVMNFLEFQRYAGLKDGSAMADLGTYMEGYEE